MQNSLDTIKLQKIEAQIESEQKSVKYDIREFTIEYYVDKYLKGEEVDKNELYVPDYQREFIWDDIRQSRFIESLMLGLPVPLIFVAEIESDGRFEIVDGSQRIRTLAAFISDKLKLKGLKKLSELNNLYFSQLSSVRQRKFKNISMRMIVLNTQASEEIRNEMFDRINTSGVSLLPMETRRGIYKGQFTDFITRLANNVLFKRLCPIHEYMEQRREEEEMVLRFFAFSETFPTFKIPGASLEKNGVAGFLDKYLEYKNANYSKENLSQKEQDFICVLKFIDKTFPNQGFAKAPGVRGVSKPYFEAIAIGAFLALKEKPDLIANSISWSILDKNNPNDFFRILSGRYHTHSLAKLKQRIEYSKEHFLK